MASKNDDQKINVKNVLVDRGEYKLNIKYELFQTNNDSNMKPINILIMNGGQSGRNESRVSAIKFLQEINKRNLSIPFNIMLIDRRNMGTSDICYKGNEPLPVEEANDIHVAINKLKLTPIILVGCSSGSRTAIVLTKKHPNDVCGLILAPPTGSVPTSPWPAAGGSLNYLKQAYYGRNLTASKTDGGMINVVNLMTTFRGREIPAHYNRMSRRSPLAKEQLLETNLIEFQQCMEGAMDWLESFKHDQIAGITDEEIKQIKQPTLIVHHGDLKDQLHTVLASETAAKLFPNAEPLLIDETFPAQPLPPTDVGMEKYVDFICNKCHDTQIRSNNRSKM